MSTNDEEDDDSIPLENTEWDFRDWGWGGSLNDWEKLWQTISENGARIALDSVLEEKAFFMIDQLDDGDFEISVSIGPFLARIKRSELTSDSGDDSGPASAFARIRVGDWRKNKTE